MIRQETVGGPEIREATSSDLGDLMEIERSSFSAPWSRALFAEELARSWARVLLLAPTHRGAPVAFINLWVVHDELHVLKIATHPAHRRRGFAETLLRNVIAEAPGLGTRYVTLELRRTNEAAMALYGKLGFDSIGVRPRYYAEDGEDAIVMLLSLEPR